MPACAPSRQTTPACATCVTPPRHLGDRGRKSGRPRPSDLGSSDGDIDGRAGRSQLDTDVRRHAVRGFRSVATEIPSGSRRMLAQVLGHELARERWPSRREAIPGSAMISRRRFVDPTACDLTGECRRIGRCIRAARARSIAIRPVTPAWRWPDRRDFPDHGKMAHAFVQETVSTASFDKEKLRKQPVKYNEKRA